jgi:hypothetical protein
MTWAPGVEQGHLVTLAEQVDGGPGAEHARTDNDDTLSIWTGPSRVGEQRVNGSAARPD